MNIRRSVVLAASLSTGVAAHAMTYHLVGEADPEDPASFTFDSGTVLVGRGGFSDLFTFTWLAGPADWQASASVIKLSSARRDITGLSATLYDAPDGTGAPAGQGLELSNLPVTDGDFSLRVTGDGTGLRGGQYILTASVSAIPEPETYALLLAGVGVAIFLSLRRNSGRD